jgi:flagellar hook protein FlgE
MPGIIDGLLASRAGIEAHGKSIGVLADNIANANTVGYKPSRADFADLVASSLGGGGAASGSGSQVISTTPIMNQGTLEFTGRSLDLGISGNGFFVVQDAGGTSQQFYSRAGNFEVDTDGFLVNQNGHRVLGFPTTGAGGLEELNVNERSALTVDTNAVSIGGNLDTSSPVVAPPGGTPTFQQLAGAAQFSTFLDVFDSLGASHTVTVYFFHTAANTWEARAYVDAGEVGGTAGDPALLGSATLSFNPDGSRVAPVPAADFSTTPAWSNGSSAQPFTFLFDPVTQFASPSGVTSITQDGTGSGRTVGFSVEGDGTLTAQLDNGRTVSVGVLALATFAAPERLRREGGSLFAETNISGEPIVGRPGTGNLGGLESGTLELSTADLAADFIKLISYQRGYQGSSRIITNINDLLSEIVNLA